MPLETVDRQYANLQKILQAYQAAVNEAAIVSITDTQGTILYVNAKFIETSKYPAEELIGKNHRIINSGFHPPGFFKDMWKTITGGKAWRGEIRNKARDGSYYWVDTVITPVVDENNRIFQFLSVRNLITHQKDNEAKLIMFQQELLKREQQLIDAQQVAKMGSWYLDVATDVLEWSNETYRIFGIPIGTPMNDALFMQQVHPEDRELLHENWEAGIKNGIYEGEHRIITPSGEKWVREMARMQYDPSGKLIAALGTVQDISEKKQTEGTIRESETLYKNLFNNSPFPNGILEKNTLRFLEVNDTATRTYGYTREEFLQLTAYDIRVPEEHERLRREVEAGEYASDKRIRAHRKKNGEIILIEPTITEILYKGNSCFLITINDVTEKMKIQDELIRTRINQQKEINRASIEAQENNRAEIGRELHDNVNQLLVASNLYLKNVHVENERDRALIEKSLGILNTAISEIRKLSWSLVPPSLDDLSLKDAIEELAHLLKLSGSVIEYDINLQENKLAKGLKLNIYRIVQEQFNNIVKYAEASKVRVAINQKTNRLSLVIADNGKGFDLREKQKGIGLNNITSRAETYNGKVQIETSPGQGCKIQVEFFI